MAKDLDRKTIYMVLSKPISRSEYIFGKFFGMVLLLLSTIAFISALAALSLFILKQGYPAFFPRFSWSLVFLGIFFILQMLILLSALSFLFASLSSTSFITLVLTIISYLIGRSLADIKTLFDTPGITGETVSPITVKVVQIAYYLFPNLSFFDIKTQIAHGLSVPLSTVLWTVLYCAVYTTLVVGLASLIFRRREFP
jgi:ABC-type transport system involved in multi-copper enzyme maturation permease subunit